MPDSALTINPGPTSRRTGFRYLAFALVAGLVLAIVNLAAMPANAAATGSVEIIQITPTPQPSSSEFSYLVSFSCDDQSGGTCENVSIRLPLDTGTQPSMLPANLPPREKWQYSFVSSASLGPVTQSFDGDTLVYTVAQPVATGQVQSIQVSLTPPNGYTANGTTWQLTPELHSTSFAAPVIAPIAVTSTATAAPHIEMAKQLTNDSVTTVRPGQQFTYRLFARCWPSAWIEPGHLFLSDGVVTDTLPAGTTFVSASPAADSVAGGVVTWNLPTQTSLPQSCGGDGNDGGGVASDRIFSVTVEVAGDVQDAAVLDNTATFTGTPIGLVDQISATDNRAVTVERYPAPWPDGHIQYISKGTNGAVSPQSTYAGNWITPINPAPSDTDSHGGATVEATFPVNVSYAATGFQTDLVDQMPCLANEAPVGTYTSLDPGSVCANPAFHLTAFGIVDWEVAANGFLAAYADGWRPEIVLTDGTVVALELGSTGNFSTWVAGGFFPVPAAYLGEVAAVHLPRHAAITPTALSLRVHGYADASLDPADILMNKAWVTPYYEDDTVAADPRSVASDLVISDSAAKLGATKYRGNLDTGVVVPAGSELGLRLQAALVTPVTVDGPVVVSELMPIGYSWTPPASGVIDWQILKNGNNGQVSYTTSSVEVLENYQGSGRTLIRFAIAGPDAGDFSSGSWLFLTQDFRPVLPADAGTGVNEIATFLPGSDVLASCVYGLPSTDNALNLDGSGDLSAQHCAHTMTIRGVVDDVPSFMVRKGVQGDLDPTPRYYPSVGVVSPVGGHGSYTLTWVNTGGDPLTDAVVYDVLPYVGDHSVLTGEPRGSEFEPTLTGVGAIPAGVAIEYSPSVNACQPEIIAIPDCVSDWSAALPAGGYAEVKAIRLSSDAQYESGEQFTVTLEVSVPELAVGEDQVAWNNVTSRASLLVANGVVPLVPTEQPKVGLRESLPGITLVKTDADGLDANTPEDAAVVLPGITTLIWFTVTNTGNTPLKDIVLSDAVTMGEAGTSEFHCDFTNSGNYLISHEWAGPFQPLDEFKCGVLLDPLAPDQMHGDLGTVTALNEADDAEVTDSDPYYAVGGIAPALQLTKYVNGDDAQTAPGPFIAEGGPVTWTYSVVNTGPIMLAPVTLSDDQIPDATFVCTIDGSPAAHPLSQLAAGEEAICTVSGTAVAGPYLNTGTASSSWQGGTITDTDPAHYFGTRPEIDLVKYTQSLFDANGEDPSDPNDPWPLIRDGGAVKWSYKVTNTGNAPLAGVEVTDDMLAPDTEITCTIDGDSVVHPLPLLQPAQLAICVAFGTAEPGSYQNTGVVTGVGPETVGPNAQPIDGVLVTDDDPSHYYGAMSAVTIVKTVNTVDADTTPGPLVAVGDSVVWRYTVTNAGNGALHDVSVTDDRLPNSRIDCGDGSHLIDELLAGESVTCIAAGVATAGQYTNFGEVAAVGPETVDVDGAPVPGEVVGDENPANYFGSAPGLDIVKRVNGVLSPQTPGILVGAGSVLDFEYTVTNTGNVGLTNVIVVDDQGIAVSCAQGASNVIAALAAGESIVCIAHDTAPRSGIYRNIATVTGVPPTTTGTEGNEVVPPILRDTDIAFVHTTLPATGLAADWPGLTALALFVIIVGGGFMLGGRTRRR